MAPISKTILLTGLVSPIALSAIRIAGGALVFFLMDMMLPSSIVKKEKIMRGDYMKLFLASILMIACNQGLYIMGVGLTSPIDATVMCTITPIFTMILAAILIGMPITWMKAAGVALMYIDIPDPNALLMVSLHAGFSLLFRLPLLTIFLQVYRLTPKL